MLAWKRMLRSCVEKTSAAATLGRSRKTFRSLELISAVENNHDQNPTPANDGPTFRRTIANLISWRVEIKTSGDACEEVAEVDPFAGTNRSAGAVRQLHLL